MYLGECNEILYMHIGKKSTEMNLDYNIYNLQFIIFSILMGEEDKVRSCLHFLKLFISADQSIIYCLGSIIYFETYSTFCIQT